MEIDKKESIEDYQITVSDDIDFLKLIDVLKKNKYGNDISITKAYVHSLFTPFLSYIINYLNHNKDKKNIFIGKTVLYGIPIVYALLNKEIYDLFFKKEKGKIGQEEINYEFKSIDENYYYSPLKEEIDKNEKNSEDILSQVLKENVEVQLENQTIDNIEEFFELKKKEIISTFRMGYSLQERIINYLHKNSNTKIIELPNIIFYKKNKKNKKKRMYSEIDRILKVDEDTEINNFLVYLKAEFLHKKNKLNITEIPKGEIFSLKKDSCYFIEVKTSIYSLFDKEKKEKDKIEDKKVEKDSKSEKGAENKIRLEDSKSVKGDNNEIKLEEPKSAKGSENKIKLEDSKSVKGDNNEIKLEDSKSAKGKNNKVKVKDSKSEKKKKNIIKLEEPKSQKSQSEIVDIKSISDLVSNNSNIEFIPKKNIRIYKNMKTFIDLLTKLNFKFKSLNLVLIIDSYFPKNFLELSKKFVETIKEENLAYDINIYFVHFEIHIEYTHQLTTSEKFEKNLKEKQIEIDNHSKRILELENNLKKMNDKLYEMDRKERLRKNKKKNTKRY